jgi:hypothetical protein
MGKIPYKYKSSITIIKMNTIFQFFTSEEKVSKYQNSNDSGVKQAFQVLAQPLRAVHGL